MSTLATQHAADPILLEGLRDHALKIEDVVLSNGTSSTYYVDVKQAMLLPALARIVGREIARLAHEANASAVGGMIVGAIPIACAALVAQPNEDLVAFIVRKDRKEHGLQRWIEGPDEFLKKDTRCLVVDDVVTTGRSTIEAIEKVRHILEMRRASLEALTKRLMDVESIDADELKKIVEENSPTPLVVPGTEAPMRLAPPEAISPEVAAIEKSG